MPPTIMADLENPETLKKIPREEITSIILMLLARLLEPEPNPASNPSKSDRLITVDEAADRLAFTSQYLYDLIRKGKFPAFREGKYLRIRESDLSAWIDRHCEKDLDKQLYHPYSIQYGWKRTQKNKAVNGAHPGTNGRQNRGKGKHDCALGTGRIEHIGTRFKVHSTADEVGNAGQTEK